MDQEAEWKELYTEQRKKLFDRFLAKAKFFGWIGNTTLLWSAWKIVVWPFILQTVEDVVEEIERTETS